MDSGLTVRTNARTARVGGARSEGTTRSASATDLSPSQTVTAAPAAPDVRNDLTAARMEASELPNIVLDAQSREVLYRTVDVGARLVERQTPEIISRRLKAYTRSNGKTTDSHNPQADFEV